MTAITFFLIVLTIGIGCTAIGSGIGGIGKLFMILPGVFMLLFGGYGILTALL